MLLIPFYLVQVGLGMYFHSGFLVISGSTVEVCSGARACKYVVVVKGDKIPRTHIFDICMVRGETTE